MKVKRKKRRKSVLLSVISFFLTLSALALLALNCYGLFKSLRNPAIYTEKKLLFDNDITLDLETMRKQVMRKQNESNKQYAIRLNEVVQTGIAHIMWDDEDVTKYYQRIPAWENYILYALSFSPFFDDFKRYHFTDYKKSIERGVGVCGDAALILSAILEKRNINTNIIAYEGHVITEAVIDTDNKIWWLFDPYFGVVIEHDLDELNKNPEIAKQFYINKGYPSKQADILVSIYKTEPDVYEDVYEFGPTKALIERFSYKLIWIIPGILLITSIIISYRNKRKKRFY